MAEWSRVLVPLISEMEAERRMKTRPKSEMLLDELNLPRKFCHHLVR